MLEIVAAALAVGTGTLMLAKTPIAFGECPYLLASAPGLLRSGSTWLKRSGRVKQDMLDLKSRGFSVEHAGLLILPHVLQDSQSH
jgi:hypothetical protein